MKRLFSRFGVTILAFIFGITATAFWFYFNPKMESYEEADFSKIPMVKQCDLKNNPRKYDGKIVRINDELKWFMHGYFFEDRNCPGEGDSARTAVMFNKQKAEQLYNYLKQFDTPNDLRKPLNITAVGRFKYEKPRGFSDHIDDRTSLHFEMFEAEGTK